jgi:hypothetical protein
MSIFRAITCIPVAVTVAGALAALAPACHQDDGGTGASTEAIQQACDLDAQAFCDKRKTCWPEGVNDFRFQRDWGTLEGCIGQRKATCLADLQRTLTALTPARTMGCAQALNAQSCQDFLASVALPTSQCPGAGAGTVDNGGACAVSAQCRSNYCNRAENETCGACADRGGIGTACDQNGDCVSSLTCQIPAGSGTGSCMTPGPAAPRGKAGEACGGTLPACDTGLSCVGTGTMRTCQAQVTMAGAACDATRKAAPDCDGALFLWCNRMTNLCERQKLAESGQPCADLPDGSFALCKGGAACVRPRDPATGNRAAAGTCLADAGQGSPCARNAADGPGCAASLRCVFDAVGAPMGVCRVQDLAACGTATLDGGRD